MERSVDSGAPAGTTEPAILGDLLLRHRDALGTSVEQLSAKSGMSAEQIEQVESGRHELTESELAALLANYEISPPNPRFEHYTVEVNLDGGWVSLHGVPNAVESPVADLNLQRYLCLVHTSQSLELGSQVPIRSVDLNLLRFALAVRPDAVLAALAEGENAETTLESIDVARKRKPAPVGIILLAGAAVVAVSFTVLQSSRSEAPPPARVEVGTALVIERSVAEATETGLAPAVTPEVDIGTALVVERSPTD